MSANTRQQRANSRRSALTFIELLLAVGIIWVLAGVSVPFLSTFLGSRQLDTTADKVVRVLRKAQSYALSGRSDSVWGVHCGAGTLVLFKGADYAARDPSFDEESSFPKAIVIAGLNDIYFQKLRGDPSTVLTIILSTSRGQRTVGVNVAGMVDVQ
jgi:Tfp pilus assembly protein FimT